LKIKELVQRTQIPKETIHYYIREGLLPKPRKRCKNMADYDESYIEKIRRIKELQYHHFLPLAVIKEILKNPKSSLKPIPPWIYSQMNPAPKLLLPLLKSSGKRLTRKSPA
jgi:DNA-binding transcriptional MerR regulator